jgi:hypothetical protein
MNSGKQANIIIIIAAQSYSHYAAVLKKMVRD